ncbi:MAG: NUDIX hydrolase [candidate division TM6 bacterium GW2011_GWE2_41_16]|nr:MAG: NUDIX hydrolase [candidate division TM6 bacterium GW2011_GWE2_41_16]
MAKERYKIIPEVYIILIRNSGQEVLLQLRQGTGYNDGLWGLVAGHVEPGEFFVDAIARETQEEIGVTINSENLVFAHTLYRRMLDGAERIGVFFATDTPGRVSQLCASRINVVVLSGLI